MACKAIGIGRRTYYNWIEEDKTFKEDIDNINESLIDFTESKLLQNIKAGKEASIFFYLKCKAKNRGYMERAAFDLEVTSKTALESRIESLIAKHGIGVIDDLFTTIQARRDSDNT